MICDACNSEQWETRHSFLIACSIDFRFAGVSGISNLFATARARCVALSDSMEWLLPLLLPFGFDCDVEGELLTGGMERGSASPESGIRKSGISRIRRIFTVP